MLGNDALVSWLQDDKHEGIRLKHFKVFLQSTSMSVHLFLKLSGGIEFSWEEFNCLHLEPLQTVSSVEWHRKGDYLSTVMPADIHLFN